MKNSCFCIGKIVGVHGLRGELKVEWYTDSPEVFFKINEIFFNVNLDPVKISGMRFHKNHILIFIDGITDRNLAMNFCNKRLYALRKDIPKDENRYFIEDLKGCTVQDNFTGKEYGILKDVFNRGASDIYSILGVNGKEYLLPIIEGTLCSVDLENDKIYVDPLKGVFDEN